MSDQQTPTAPPSTPPITAVPTPATAAPTTGPAAGAPTAGTPAVTATPADVAAIATPPAPAAPAAPPAATPPGQVETFPRSYVEELRRESAGYRTDAGKKAEALTAAEQERDAAREQVTKLMAELGKLAGVPAPEETPQDPALTAKLEAAEAARAAEAAEAERKIRNLTVAGELPAAATAAGADPALLRAVLAHDGVLDRIDPSTDTWKADLVSAAKAAVESTPALRLTPVVTVTGTEPTGPAGTSDQLTREQVNHLAKTDPAGLVEAQKAGRLRTLLGG